MTNNKKERKKERKRKKYIPFSINTLTQSVLSFNVAEWRGVNPRTFCANTSNSTGLFNNANNTAIFANLKKYHSLVLKMISINESWFV